jgi:hypothetical protein
VSFVSWSDFRLVLGCVSFVALNTFAFVSDLQAIREPFVLGGMIA